MAQITYANKVALNENPEIANINKVTDDDMNEIKQVVNDNYNNTIQITDTEPTDSDNKIWIDTGEVGSQASEITNEYSTSTGLGYSANYVNKLFTYSTTEQRVGTWVNNKPIYMKVFNFTVASSGGDSWTQFASYSENYIDEIVDVSGFFYLNNTKAFRIIGGSEFPNGAEITRIIGTGSAIAFQRNAWDSDLNVYAIIKYTKTTD